MDHYCKGKNIEEELTRECVPFSDLPENFCWTELTGSSKVRTMVGSLAKSLRQDKCLVLSGSGPHTSKVVTMAEIIKRRQKHCGQSIEFGERTVQEYWEPRDEEEGLDSLVVTRRIPTIHILLEVNKSSSTKLSPDDELCEALWPEESNRVNNIRKPKHKD